MIKKIYNSKWFPRLFCKRCDGGKDSGVTAYFLIEWKILFSIGLLNFKKGSRENYHSHAFHACTWWLTGGVAEKKMVEDQIHFRLLRVDGDDFYPSFKPKITPKSNIHKIIAYKDTWALTFRGPWDDTWYEVTPENKFISLTHRRQIV